MSGMNHQPSPTPVANQLSTPGKYLWFFGSSVNHIHPNSAAVNEPQESIGFLIQRAVSDLRMAMHWLQIDIACDAMSSEEALTRQRVLEAIQELLLACQLIAIPELATS